MAYTNRTDNIPIEADWSNGSVGMAGTSYVGTTQFALACTGVEGLKTIIPTAGIASWYDYTNSQGMYRSQIYSSWLGWLCSSRMYDDSRGEFEDRYRRYYKQINADENALNGDYGKHWQQRNAMLDKDKISCSALIVHGLNDYNVRPKHFKQMYDSFKSANQEVKLIIHQGDHKSMSLAGYTYLINGEPFNEIANKWYSHYLCGIENGIEDMTEVNLQDSHNADIWHEYDSFEESSVISLSTNDDTHTEITNIHNLTENTSFYDYISGSSTTESALYSGEVTEDTIIKGTATVSFSASAFNVSGELQLSEYSDIFIPMGDSEPIRIKRPTYELEAAEDLNKPLEERDGLPVTAALVDIAPDGESISAFGGNSNTVKDIDETKYEDTRFCYGTAEAKYHIKTFVTAETKYKIIASGYMDLCNPTAGYQPDEAAADTKISLSEGESHDYTIYLNPAFYELKKGHRLAIVLFTNDVAMTNPVPQPYGISFDNSTVTASIPTTSDSSKITVSYEPIDKLTLNVSAGEGGQISAYMINDEQLTDIEIGNEIDYGKIIAIHAVEKNGYCFKGRYKNGKLLSDSEDYVYTAMDSDEITAEFEKSILISINYLSTKAICFSSIPWHM